MSLDTFLAQVKRGEPVSFESTLHQIAAFYEYQPCAFQNNGVHNAKGHNEGSCRLFAFARRHGLNPAQTLALFGQHYQDVLSTPQGSDHANIRAFMRGGWAGVVFDGEPLTPRSGPGARNQEPGTRNQEPGTRGQGPGTRGQGPGPGARTRGQGPGTRDQEPGARDQGPGTRGQEPEI